MSTDRKQIRSRFRGVEWMVLRRPSLSIQVHPGFAHAEKPTMGERMLRRSQIVTVLMTGCVALAGCGGLGQPQQTGGIYAKLGYSEAGGLRVVDVPPGGAADLGGLQVGDVIIGIDGTSVRELDYPAIVDRLRGPVGSSVQLEIFRDGEVATVVIMRQAYTR